VSVRITLGGIEMNAKRTWVRTLVPRRLATLAAHVLLATVVLAATASGTTVRRAGGGIPSVQLPNDGLGMPPFVPG
jgi:hypothetical protein